MKAHEKHWYKVCTHMHTNNSDGDSSPEVATEWYRKHGFNAVFITDHNHTTDISKIATDDNFIVIAGNEISDGYRDKALHVCALGIDPEVQLEPPHGVSIIDTLQNDIDLALAHGGIAQVNHPNYQWAFGEEEIASLRGAKLLEIINMTKDCNNFGGGGVPSVEEMWDGVLSRGHLWYGVMSDDAHQYTGDITPESFTPGKGWLMVRASELTREAILEALLGGDFYATNGVDLAEAEITQYHYHVKIHQWWGVAKYTTLYIGRHGEVLQTSYGLESSYSFRGNEGYVRVKILASTGDVALLQPVML